MSDEAGQVGTVDPAEEAFAQAAERLYAVPLSEFMATRTELVAAARAAKDRPLATRIGKLRKPSVAAGLVNQLVRAHPVLVEQVRSVGAQLRAAQANLHGTAISALRPARDAVIVEVLAAAETVARAGDAPLTAAARDEIRDTVIASLASEEATEALASGALTRTLAYSGFGEVDLDDAVVEGFRMPTPKLVLLRPPRQAEPERAPHDEPVAAAGREQVEPELDAPATTAGPEPERASHDEPAAAAGREQVEPELDAPATTPEPDGPDPAPPATGRPEPPVGYPLAGLARDSQAASARRSGADGEPGDVAGAEATAAAPKPAAVEDPLAALTRGLGTTTSTDTAEVSGDTAGAPSPGATRESLSSSAGASTGAADDDDADPEALIEAAAQAYAAAAERVAQAKAAVAQASSELDSAKGRADNLRAQLAATEAELADLFARDAQAREAVTQAVQARQAAAELLARREAQA